MGDENLYECTNSAIVNLMHLGSVDKKTRGVSIQKKDERK